MKVAKPINPNIVAANIAWFELGSGHSAHS